MNEGSLQTTFVLSENGLIQTSSNNSGILSETIIDDGSSTSNMGPQSSVQFSEASLGPAPSSVVVQAAHHHSNTVIYTEADTVMDVCSSTMDHQLTTPATITIQPVSSGQFLSQTTDHLGTSDTSFVASSTASLPADAPVYMFNTGNTFFKTPNSSINQLTNNTQANFTSASTLQYSPIRLEKKASPVAQGTTGVQRKIVGLPYSVTRVDNSGGNSSKKATFKIIRNASSVTTNIANVNNITPIEVPNSVNGKSKPFNTISLKNVNSGQSINISGSESSYNDSAAVENSTVTAAKTKSTLPKQATSIANRANKTSSSKSSGVPQLPPVGSVSKLARHATLIDLNKIKKERDCHRPILIDQVTVMIDQADNVKVVDYGTNSPNLSPLTSNFYSPIKSENTKSPRDLNNSKFRHDRAHSNNNKSLSSNHKHKSLHSSNEFDSRFDSGAGGDQEFEFSENFESDDGNTEPSHDQFEDPSLGTSLEHMRQLRVDCNVALVDPYKEYMVYAHRAVLVARSPYFYNSLYLRRKKLQFLHQFCRFTLPHNLNFEAVEAVVSYMYSGVISSLYGCSAGAIHVLKVLKLFEMTEAAELFAAQLPPEALKAEPPAQRTKEIKAEPMEEDGSSLLLPYLDSPPAEEVTIDERKKRRRTHAGGEHDRAAASAVSGNSASSAPNNSSSGTTTGFMVNSSGEEVRMKASVQKLVESALTPFLSKLEELFDPNSTTMQVARTSQHVITLWNADLLLTKLFDQNELTKYFTDYLNEVGEAGEYSVDTVTSSVGSFAVETLSDTSRLDEVYTKVGSSDSVVPEMETLTVCDMQIINYYSQMDPKYIPNYVRLISLYKFRIGIGCDPDGKVKNKAGLLTPMLQGEEPNNHFHNIVEGLEDNALPDGLNGMDQRMEEITRLCIRKVSRDLSRRTIADLDAKLNANYQEEMIMHIIVEQMESDRILPLCIGIFLAKGCSFCRKRECKSEDLATPIGPDNPVCPDRQCIRRNLICHICNKQMANSKSLARHKYSVHDVQNGETAGLFICSHCGETFSKKWKLNVHEKQHEDRKRQESCHICNKVMRGAVALKKHINMVHETKRQFMCDHCPKMFKRKETLQVHRRIHTGEKPFVCSHCDYSSETKGNLKAHTWRKHKRPLLATSVGNNGVETSITGPIESSSIEDMMESGDVCEGIGASNGEGDGGVLDGPVLELEGQVTTTAEDEHAMAASLVAHDHLQESTFMIT